MPTTAKVFYQTRKSTEDRNQGLIDDLLKQKADAIKLFNDKLAKQGDHNVGKPKRNHHNLAEPEKTITKA
jgi:hypothetical protein